MILKEKILIVNNNLQIGGIQKSLINLLNATKNHYDITLLLFSDYGELYAQIPNGIHVILADKRLQVLGTPWVYLKSDILAVFYKIVSYGINRFFGKKRALKYLFRRQSIVTGFDHIISFSHCTNQNNLSVCTPEFVLECTEGRDKICFIHCDYKNSDTFSLYNNGIYGRFDKIACCSKSVMERFLSCAPDLREKTYVVENFYDMNIPVLAKEDSIKYNAHEISIVIVARLSYEKGVLRAIKALKNSNRCDIKLFIVGDGPEKNAILEYLESNHVKDKVCLLGEQRNPYRFMSNADYLLVPSYHEAAPMVFDEAKILGVSIISTDTTSAIEMVGNKGFVIENSDEALCEMFKQLEKTDVMETSRIDNYQKNLMWEEMLNGKTK